MQFSDLHFAIDMVKLEPLFYSNTLTKRIGSIH
jgi:hypothetical protein